MNGKTYNGIMKIDFVNHNKDDDHVIKSIILKFGIKQEILFMFLKKNLNPYKTLMKNIRPKIYFVMITREFCCLAKTFKSLKAYQVNS